MINKIHKFAALIRDIGLIVGIPIIVLIAFHLYNIQVAALKEQNEILKITQYDKALNLIESQKKYLNMKEK